VGFQIGMALLTDPRLSLKAYVRQVEEGFLRRMDQQFTAMGFDVPQRSNPLDRRLLEEKWSLSYLAFYDKNLLDPRRYLKESRRLLGWKP